MRTIKLILLALLLLLAGAFLHFYLPSKDVVRVVGTDVKRMDVVSRDFVAEGDENRLKVTRDVRFINTAWPNGKPRVYRNEETGWGFPWYFKFDSGNVQAKAQNLISTEAAPRWIVVTHYGWRFEIFSMFPNAVELTPVESPDVWPIPWFNIAFFVSLAGLALIVWRIVAHIRRRHIDPLIDGIETEVSEYADQASRSAESVERGVSGLYERWQRWLDTWRPKHKRRYR